MDKLAIAGTLTGKSAPYISHVSMLTSHLSYFNIGTGDSRNGAAIAVELPREVLFMSENMVTGASSVDPLKSVADALETAVQAAKDGAADARLAVDKALPAASRFLSRFVYTTSYTLSYGVVFPAALIAKSIPSDNALVHGLVDGAKAASDAVDEWKSQRSGALLSEPPATLSS